MFNAFRDRQFQLYNKIRKQLIVDPSILIELEKYFADYVVNLLRKNLSDIKADYDEASFLYPFWQQYPPDDRGRKPRGDQFPWIEVGEHVLGDKLPRLLEEDFCVRDVGIPTGPDKRFILSSTKIKRLTNNMTDSIWLFVDIKSVGPRDDFEHTVMSHNQISGNGQWVQMDKGISNRTMYAIGKRKKHKFHCSIPPVYILSDNTVAPVVLIAIKPVYDMLSVSNPKDGSGQPLKKITVVSIPNGLLLEENPKYLKMNPGLLFPGKDDKQKNPLKVRSRISFDLLRKIDGWRVVDV